MCPCCHPGVNGPVWGDNMDSSKHGGTYGMWKECKMCLRLLWLKVLWLKGDRLSAS